MEEVMALRFRIKELNGLQSAKKSDELDFLTSVKGVLRILAEAKAIYEVNDKILGLRDGVAKAFGFVSTCQTMMKTSDESIREALEISVKGAENALKTKLSNFLEIFPKERIILVKDLIMNVSKIPTGQGDRQNFNKIFKEDDILTRIESMMKKLGDDQTSKLEANEAAAQESAHALATLSGTLVCISSFVAPNNSLENLEKPNQCIPDVDAILKNAINALKHELNIKESWIDMNPKGKFTKSHFAVQNANLQDILHQIDADLGDLLKVYSVNLELSKKLDSPDCDLDVTNLEERLDKVSEAKKTGNAYEPENIGNAPEPEELANATESEKIGNAPEPKKLASTSEPEKLADAPEPDFDDGLSDVGENVSMCCDDEYHDQGPPPQPQPPPHRVSGRGRQIKNVPQSTLVLSSQDTCLKWTTSRN